jgi:spore coat-associated protein N
MKKLLFVAMACVLAIGLVGGAFAYFSDTETSTGNTFTAGSMDISCVIGGTGSGADVHENADGSNDYVTFSNLKPGDSGSIIWTVTNTGSLPGYIMIHRTLSADNDGIDTEPELVEEPGANGVLTDGELDENMVLTSSCKIDGVSTFGADTYTGMMSLEGTYGPHQFDHLPKLLNPGSVLQVVYAWSIPTTATNNIQGDTFTLNFVFDLDQISTP